MIACLGIASFVGAAEPELKIISGGSTQSITRAELGRKLQAAQITVYSPVYQRQMTYEGFWLDEIFRALHASLGDQDISFECADHYGTSMPAGDVGEKKWLVAYGELPGLTWTPLPERHALTLPGPWYVVGRDPSSYNDFPWPYQVISIQVSGSEF